MWVVDPRMLLCTSRATSSGPTVWTNLFVAMPEMSAVRVNVGFTVLIRTPCGDSSVFALLDGIVADLKAGTNVNPRLSEIDAAAATVRGVQADVGVRHATVLATQDALKSDSVSLESKRSGIEDKDLAKAVLDLQLQQTNYQAALAVTAKVLQPTLMDYLR